MKMMSYISFCLLALVSSVFGFSCFTRQGCMNEESGTDRETYEYWVNASDETGSCSMCLCAETKVYTNSCIVADNNSYVKKGGLLNLLKLGASMLANRTSEKTTIRDEEIRLPEEDAKVVQCDDIPEMIHNEETGTFHYPPLKYVHYYYVDKVSHCCTNKVSTENLENSCRVKFNDRCQARIVFAGAESKLCGLDLFTGSSSNVKKND